MIHRVMTSFCIEGMMDPFRQREARWEKGPSLQDLLRHIHHI